MYSYRSVYWKMLNLKDIQLSQLKAFLLKALLLKAVNLIPIISLIENIYFNSLSWFP